MAVGLDHTKAPDAPRSPTPTPQAPVSQVPGQRAQNLNKVFTGALNHTTSTCSYAHFASCFPTPAKYNKPLLESVHRQVQNMIETRSRREFDEIMTEKDVVKGLNELDGLIAEAKRRRERKEEPIGQPLHEMAPHHLFLAHLTPYLEETRLRTETQIQAQQDENESLVQDIKQQEEDIEKVIQGLETAIADLEDGVGVLQDAVDDGQLRQEAQELDSDITRRRDEKASRL